jgi:hypothetical protein
MFARQHQNRSARACNDNGFFLAIRPRDPVLPMSIVRIAIDLGGSISLTYLADGVLIIGPAAQNENRPLQEVA